MVCVWSNEQAIREIYLKPFEISVKVGDAHAVMVSWSFIGIKWSGENSNLLNTVLRDEWGFEGFTLTDFFRNIGHGFMNADAALATGVDAMLSTYAGGPNVVQNPDAASSVKYMRQACKNVMYTVVNSWMYEEDGVNTSHADLAESRDRRRCRLLALSLSGWESWYGENIKRIRQQKNKQ